MAKEIISYNLSDKIKEEPALDWDELSAEEAGKLDIAETQKSVKAKYAEYFKQMGAKKSDEIISIIDHLESLNYFMGNRCGFWGETKLSGIIRNGQKIYDWDKLESEEKAEILSDIPSNMLFEKNKNANDFFVEATKDDYNKKTTESNIILDGLGILVDPLIEKEEKEKLEKETRAEEIQEAA